MMTSRHQVVFLLMLTSFVCWSQKQVITNLHKFRQPDDVDSYYYLSRSNETSLCTRQCVKGDHRICYYRMVVENYAVLTAACGNCINNSEDCKLPQCVTADGFEKGILTVNRRIPGPGIHVCYGDKIVVDVINSMLARTVSIHWHGMIQKNTAYMDGVPLITQCPIPESTTFRYNFIADTVGTLYWHSHSALHKLNGLQGSLIVRQPEEDDPVSGLYDYDLPAHVLFISDWYHTAAETRFPGLLKRDFTQDTTFYLINGQGRYVYGKNNTTTTPYHVFHVLPGMRYRFRVIGAVGTQCPAMLQVEGHKLLLIATDGSPIKPVVIDSLEIYSGERYDFVLKATKHVDCYWILVRGMQNCFKNDVFQLAILHYEGINYDVPHTPKPSLDNFSFKGRVMNPIDASCGNEDVICVSQLMSLREVPRRILTREVDHNIEIKFGFDGPSPKEVFQTNTHHRYLQVKPDTMVFPWVNNIQMLRPPSPLQSQYDDIPKDIFCPNDTHGLPVCPKDHKKSCSCVPIIKISLGDLVQLVLIDIPYKSGPNHPFHLHGATFNVLSMGYLPKQLLNAKDVNKLLQSNQIPVTDPPVYKDTLAVPSGGYAVIRFIANNPGYWLFHCHFAFHHEGGMATVFKVGEHSEFPPLPKNFPKCGDFLPSVQMNIGTNFQYTTHSNIYPKETFWYPDDIFG